ncbi:hypothetical protein CUR95_21585 [Bordetella bronchiseptica]|nr:hypothetical protein [Bordetella bronchiseptica]
MLDLRSELAWNKDRAGGNAAGVHKRGCWGAALRAALARTARRDGQEAGRGAGRAGGRPAAGARKVLQDMDELT